MEKYGFFGGSFNPVTKAHVELAQEIVDKYELDKVIFVPVGEHYNKKGLASEKDRYNMLEIATRGYDKLDVSDIELNQDKNLSTLEAFSIIEKEYPSVEKYYIMGVDNMYKMLLSEDFDILVEKYKYIVIQRKLMDCKELIKSNETFSKYEDHFMIMENEKYSKASSTNVRYCLQESSPIEDMMDETVLEYIEENGLYR